MKALWLLCIATLLGCPAKHARRYEDAGPAAQDLAPVLTEAEYREQYVAAKNDLNVRCCEQAGLRYQVPEEFWPALPPLGRAFDGAAAAACVAYLEQQPCELQKELPPGGSDACGEVYALGTSAPGEPCASHLDCALGADGERLGCAVSNEGGVCFRSTIVGEGETCGRVASHHYVDCELPLFCDDSRVCVRPAKLGETCVTGPVYGDTCEPGAVCDRQGTKRCVKPRAVGAPCTALEDCENLACVRGQCREPLFVVPLCERT